MQVVGLDEVCREDILSVVAGILHLGNITFVEQGNYAAIADPGCKYHNYTPDKALFSTQKYWYF